MNHDSILEKVRALLAKAEEGRGATEEEAESCIRLAHKLLEKHNLSMSDLPADQQDEKAESQVMNVMYADPWRTEIVRAACRLYFCSFFFSKWFDQLKYEIAMGNYRDEHATYEQEKRQPGWKWQRAPNRPKLDTYYRPTYVVVGREHNRAVCISMIEYLWATVLRLGNEYVADPENLAYVGATKRAALLDFTRGCGDRIATRMTTIAYKAQRDAAKDAKSHGNALTIYDNYEKENHDLMDTLGLTSRRTAAVVQTSAHGSAGWEAGEHVSLNGQIGAQTKGAKLLPKH